MHKREGHQQQNWHKENHDHDSRHDHGQYDERRLPYYHQKEYDHHEHHEHYDHDQTKGVHPNYLLPQPYPEVQCKSKNCQKSHNNRERY